MTRGRSERVAELEAALRAREQEWKANEGRGRLRLRQGERFAAVQAVLAQFADLPPEARTSALQRQVDEQWETGVGSLVKNIAEAGKLITDLDAAHAEAFNTLEEILHR